MDIKNEYDYLIHLISCFLNDKKPDEIPEKISFEKVFEFAALHDVANIAFLSLQKLSNVPDGTVYDNFRLEYRKSVKRDTIQQERISF